MGDVLGTPWTIQSLPDHPVYAAEAADVDAGSEVVGLEALGKSVCWAALELDCFHPHLSHSVIVTAITGGFVPGSTPKILWVDDKTPVGHVKTGFAAKIADIPRRIISPNHYRICDGLV